MKVDLHMTLDSIDRSKLKTLFLWWYKYNLVSVIIIVFLKFLAKYHPLNNIGIPMTIPIIVRLITPPKIKCCRIWLLLTWYPVANITFSPLNISLGFDLQQGDEDARW